jgi:hypothetical protein
MSKRTFENLEAVDRIGEHLADGAVRHRREEVCHTTAGAAEDVLHLGAPDLVEVDHIVDAAVAVEVHFLHRIRREFELAAAFLPAGQQRVTQHLAHRDRIVGRLERLLLLCHRAAAGRSQHGESAPHGEQNGLHELISSRLSRNQ